MRGTFLDLLGLPLSATDEDIKKRYRELVMKLHPDVNDSPHAAEQFQLVQKAYEFLTNEDKQLEMMYQQYRKTKGSSEPSVEQSVEERQAELRERARFYSQRAQKEAEEIELNVFNMLTQRVPWLVVRFLAACSVFFGLLILIDFFVPVSNPAKELKFKVHKELFQKNTLVFTDGDKIDVPEQVYLGLEKGDSLGMEYSGILHEFLGYRIHRQDGSESLVESKFSLFTFYPLFAFMFMIPGFLFFYQANEVRFYLLYFATCVAYPGLVLHYILREDKLKYLLEFLF
jgi:hypothetical protein